jgi:prepilin-type N-terminal cleavage/methylation domain-containing protein
MHLEIKRTSSSSGFTLIELLVVISIMILIFGGGISAYLRIDRRQSLSNVCSQIEQYARTAQKRARVGDKPAGCTTLNGYRVSRTSTGPDVISLQAVCTNATYNIETYDVPTQFTITAISAMNFRVLHGGLMETGPITITARSTGPNYQCQFSVENGGSVSATTITTY